MLRSLSSNLHGQLWSDIQARNRALYRPAALIGTWRRWRKRPSSYPLALYFAWAAIHRLLPKAVFAALFRRLLPYSQSRRAS